MKLFSTLFTLRFFHAALVAVPVLITGCASTETGNMSREAVLAEVRDRPKTVFAQPLARVHDAALRSLTTVGCEIEARQDYHVSGSRPRKFGLFVGSGGEIVDIYMLPEGDKSTDVWVNSDRTFVGMAGQRNWEKPVLTELTNLLGK